MKNIELYNGYILCEEHIVENKTKSGIILPKKNEEREKDKLFKIVNIDESEQPEGTKIKVKIGDIVAVNGGYSTVIEGRAYVMIKQANIIYKLK
jgi:co-chaperonin GroES (HSP10)